jgi:ElaB/YqjD/DUF883 family membrane-anchored ribosome-binding protein
MATETQTARDQLIEDFKKVVDDAEELLKVTANETGGKIGEVRQRAEETLREARRKLRTIEGDLIMQAKTAAKATDQLVHENPWQSVAIAAGVGLLFGMLSSRR